MRLGGKTSLAILIATSSILLNLCQEKPPADNAEKQPVGLEQNSKKGAPSSPERRAQLDACLSQLANLAARVGLFQAVAGALPESLAPLLVGDQTDVTNQLTAPWNNKIEYTVEGNTFTLRSLGPDGVSESADDICYQDEEEDEAVSPALF